ncbi:hypothetical protein [Dickeya dianthicola]|nr:hypothetical protein [Dickeya dianthicola]MCI4238395.1 hypothetical protein [Dickeya dianthicola]MCI4254358.1 hypothetical protein [Dickeya dianthicola]
MRFRPRSSRFWWLLAGLAAITLFVVFRLSRPAPNYITATVDAACE